MNENANIRVVSSKVIQVIETKSAVGNGTEDSPTRIVTEYFDFNGERLAEYDPISKLYPYVR